MSEGFEELISNGGTGKVGAMDGVAGLSKIQNGPSQYDLTGYMIHILMKVSEMLYLSVC